MANQSNQKPLTAAEGTKNGEFVAPSKLYTIMTTSSKKNEIIFRILIGLSEDRRAYHLLGLEMVKPIPLLWAEDLATHHVNLVKFHYKNENPKSYNYSTGAKSVGLGLIIYKHHKEKRKFVAITKNYHPLLSLNRLEGKAAGGFPYLIEYLATQHLKAKIGVTHISTSASPKPPRIRQLKRVELPICTEVEVDEWLRGMGRGIRQCVLANYNRV